MEDFIKKFQIEDLMIGQVGSWVISIRPKQINVGSLVISLSRDCPHLGEMTTEEGKDLALTFEKVENLLNESFNPDQINYLALMMVDNQVHFHVIPRYQRPVSFANNSYNDNNWPKPPVLSETIDVDLEKLKTFFQSKF